MHGHSGKLKAEKLRIQTDLSNFPLKAGEPWLCCLHQLREHGTTKRRKTSSNHWKNDDISGIIGPTAAVNLLGIMLKVHWVQQTLHLLTVGEEMYLDTSLFKNKGTKTSHFPLEHTQGEPYC